MQNGSSPGPARPDSVAARRIRERAGWSRQQMADELGVHANSIVRWEAGGSGPEGVRLAGWIRLLDRLSTEIVQTDEAAARVADRVVEI